jgi:hypothetical protein
MPATQPASMTWKERALSIRCPTCGAVAGKPCVTARMKEREPHLDRVNRSRD